MKNEQIITPQLAQTTPDNTLEMDISSVKSLQIGYHAETIFLHKTEGKSLILKEYIGGLSGSEYYAKVSANRIKTTIRYGRREEVNHNTYVEVFLPESWHGELSLSSQYGHITTEDDWIFDRFDISVTRICCVVFLPFIVILRTDKPSVIVFDLDNKNPVLVDNHIITLRPFVFIGNLHICEETVPVTKNFSDNI